MISFLLIHFHTFLGSKFVSFIFSGKCTSSYVTFSKWAIAYFWIWILCLKFLWYYSFKLSFSNNHKSWTVRSVYLRNVAVCHLNDHNRGMIILLVTVNFYREGHECLWNEGKCVILGIYDFLLTYAFPYISWLWNVVFLAYIDLHTS